jgi:hypothetical protein
MSGLGGEGMSRLVVLARSLVALTRSRHLLESSEERVAIRGGCDRYTQRQFDYPTDYFSPLLLGVSMVLIHN